MFRASLLCIACFSIVGSSDDFDHIAAEPVCDKKSHKDLYFDLSKRGLNAVQKPFVRGPSVKCINLEGNSIETIDQEVFDDLPELTYLNLAKNPVSFDNFTKINFGKLETLMLDGPFKYETTPQKPSSPIKLLNLKKLWLRNHNNGSSVLTWLDHLNAPNLTHLYIAGNRITEIYTQKSFARTLTHLNVDDNKVNFFSTNYTKLQNLSLDHNQIENVCRLNCNWHSLSLFGMSKLNYLSLSENSIESIESDAFEDLKELQIMNLNENRISHLDRNLFDKMTSLKNLSLTNNELGEVPHICRLKELEFLNLGSNKIKFINGTSFCNLRNLRVIGLGRNSLESISMGTFDDLPGLKVLDLSWNNIAKLPANWISSKIVSMDFVNLEGNDFTTLANMSLIGLPMIDKLCIGIGPMVINVAEVRDLPVTMNISLYYNDCNV